MRNRAVVGGSRRLDGARRIHRLTVTTVLVLVTWLSYEATRSTAGTTAVSGSSQLHGSHFGRGRYLIDEEDSIFEDDRDHEDDHDHDHEEEEHELEDHGDNHLNHSETPWLEGIVAAMAINLASLFCVIIISVSASILHFKTKCCSIGTVLGIVLPSLAIGTLMATTVFLILPEALHLIEKTPESDGGHTHRRSLVVDGRRYLEIEAHEDHEEEWAAWRFGTAILGGFVLPFFVSSFFPRKVEWVEDPLWSEAIGVEESEFEAAQREKRKKKKSLETSEKATNPHLSGARLPMGSEGTTSIAMSNGVPNLPQLEVQPMDEEASGTEEDGDGKNWKLAWTILAGDFIHNFVDGILVGNSFLLCDRRTSVVVCVATFLHEITQELVDFALLTNQCGFKVGTALEANFLSGVSILFGVVVILGIENMSAASTGAILAISAGIYIYLGGVELFPPVLKKATSFNKRMLFILCFSMGAVPIGLVLLNHVHCEE